VLGSADLSVNINGLIFCHTFRIVDNLNFSVLLGYDFLTANKAEISIVDQTLSLMHGLVVVPLVQNSDGINLLTLTQSVTIPPKSEAWLPVLINHRYRPQLSLIEAWPAKPYNNLLVAKCLVKPVNHFTSCKIANFTNRPRRLKKGSVVAMITPVNAADSVNRKTLNPGTFNKFNSVNTTETTDHVTHEEKLHTLQALGISFKDTVLEHADMVKMCNFLYKNRDLFATDMTQLPPSNLPAMKIELTDYKPIRQKQYRMSPHLLKEAERQCLEMEKSGIIRPSLSPFNLPCIMVKKFDQSFRLCLDARL
jgi:hypothetical protein